MREVPLEMDPRDLLRFEYEVALVRLTRKRYVIRIWQRKGGKTFKGYKPRPDVTYTKRDDAEVVQHLFARRIAAAQAELQMLARTAVDELEVGDDGYTGDTGTGAGEDADSRLSTGPDRE